MTGRQQRLKVRGENNEGEKAKIPLPKSNKQQGMIHCMMRYNEVGVKKLYPPPTFLSFGVMSREAKGKMISKFQ